MLITISAQYGAGGVRVAREVAARLGVPFLDRLIPVTVAERLSIPVEDVVAGEESVGQALSRLPWLIVDVGIGALLTHEDFRSDDLKRETEQVVRERAATGNGVILGRAAGIILRDDPTVLRVRLVGPVERRVAAAMSEAGIDRKQAERDLHDYDRAREEYARHFYRVDVRDPALYHMVLDTTTLPLEASVDLIVTAGEWLIPTTPEAA